MKDTFLYTLRAILPILLVILLGYVVSRKGPWDDRFYKQLNKMCFSLFLPIHLFCSVYQIENLGAVKWRIIGFLLGVILLCTLFGVVLTNLLVSRRDQKGVLIQNAFRSNQAILGLTLAQSLGGEAAVSFAAVATSLFVPLYNVFGVIALTAYSGDGHQRPDAKTLVRRVITNPLIIGALSALVLVFLRQLLPVVNGQPVFTLKNQMPSVYQALNNLAKIAPPAMLFVLGARLDFSKVKGLLPQLSLGIALRLVMAPLLGIGLAVLFREPLGLTTLEMPTLVAVTATPVAASSAVMVQEIGGDDQLASQLVVWTSVFSLVSIFCIVYVLRSIGML